MRTHIDCYTKNENEALNYLFETIHAQSKQRIGITSSLYIRNVEQLLCNNDIITTQQQNGSDISSHKYAQGVA